MSHTTKQAYIVITEENQWEGETWTHVFPKPPDQSLLAALELVGELPGFEAYETDDPPGPYESTHGYIPEVVWFGGVHEDLPSLVEQSSQDELEERLYKGQLRKFGKDGGTS